MNDFSTGRNDRVAVVRGARASRQGRADQQYREFPQVQPPGPNRPARDAMRHAEIGFQR
jgi:hypothetical protein